MMKEDNHVFHGMRRGNHQISQKGEFLWDARNIRLTNRGESTLFSITNEVGTSDKLLTLNGEYVGHCVLGIYLVVFTADDKSCYIYRINKEGSSYKTIILFQGDSKDGWSSEHPIEALASYETALIQKVYWIDGKHQPRVINITKPELSIPESLHSSLIKDGVNFSDISKSALTDADKEILEQYMPLYSIGTFDFVTPLKSDIKVSVFKELGTGSFPSGVIQYAMSYYNTYGQESNLFYTTSLNYISNYTSGADGETSVANAFKIEITNPDTEFDYIRVYSIHRTSLDAEPTCKIVGDISMHKGLDKVSLLDDGTIGTTITPSQLLYIGGREVVPQTMVDKDGTLFLGNLDIKQSFNRDTIQKIVDKYKESILKNYTYTRNREDKRPRKPVYYDYAPDLNQGNSATFKIGETYRLGIQVQDKLGVWSDPFYITDTVVSDPDTIPEDEWRVIHTKSVVSKDFFTSLKDEGVRAVRTCVVFPKLLERDIICQGVLNPTVYSFVGRRDNAPYAQSSWFFRPACNLYTHQILPETLVVGGFNRYNNQGSRIEYRHNHALIAGYSRSAEIQNMRSIPGINDIDITGALRISTEADKERANAHFFIDENLVTFHSPDIEFDEAIQNIFNSERKFQLRIIGVTQLGAIYGDMSAQTSTATMFAESNGFIREPSGYMTSSKQYNSQTPVQINGGLVTGALFNEYNPNEHQNYAYLVYPWHRSGSLNNDRARNDGVRTAQLSKKQLSNLKFFDKNSSICKVPYTESETNADDSKYYQYDIYSPQVFNSNDIALIKVDSPMNQSKVNYYGNVETIVTTGNLTYNTAYEIVYSLEGTRGAETDFKSKTEDISTDPVSMKYKSSPHLVFALDRCLDSKVTKETFNEALKSGKVYTELLPRCIDTKCFLKDGASIPAHLGDTYEYPYSPIPQWFYNPNSIDSFVNFNGKLFGIFRDVETCNRFLKRTLSIEAIGSYVLIQLNHNEYSLYRVGKKIASDVYSLCIVPALEGELILGDTLNVDRNTVFVTGCTSSNFNDIDNPNINLPDMNWTSDPQNFTKSFISDIDSPDLSNTEDITGFAVFSYKINNLYYGIKEINTGEVTTLSLEIVEQPGNIGSYIPYATAHTAQRLFRVNSDEENTTPPYLLLAEIINVSPNVKFGGKSPEALEQNLWVPSSEPMYIDEAIESSDPLSGKAPLIYRYGDTWYGRYDCLKTYAYSPEDVNQVVEIGSFLCESRVNLDGKFDDSRNKLSHLVTSPQNFNLMNQVYSQLDNYFNYRILSSDLYKQDKFSNQITWSLEKAPAADIDQWTALTVSNTYDLDGSKGPVTALKVFKDNLLCFQEKALNSILFNSRVQVQSSDGVPIEISNGGKLDGSRVIADIGCTNKWSIVNTPKAIYFADALTNDLYGFNGQMNSLGKDMGMDWWVQLSSIGKVWSPRHDVTINGGRTFYDAKYSDVYFTPGPLGGDTSDALCYSEQLEQFTSFLSYGGTEAMFNFADGFYSLKKATDGVALYQNNVGSYNNFYGEFKGWNISFISNEMPSYTKIFDTIELRADCYSNDEGLLNSCPITLIEAENEYQKSKATKETGLNMRKKFRVWRGLIPRNTGTRERIRNPWAKITLGWNPLNDNSLESKKYNSRKSIIHDVSVKYTI